jgi:hypothetical protein
MIRLVDELVSTSSTPEKAADLRVKHLEMVQAVVSRLANYGATLKNYCITLTVALSGLAVSQKLPAAFGLAVLAILVFAILDAQYLRLERRFRRLFDTLREGDWSARPDFRMDIGDVPRPSFWAAFFSWSIGVFYLPLAVAVLCLWVGIR